MEQISRLELDRLVKLYDLVHNADFSDASDKATDEAYSEYIREIKRLHETKFRNLSFQQIKTMVATKCLKMISTEKKPKRGKRR
jgi:hypothetical protein